MVITVFRSRLRPEHSEEYERWATRMHDLAVKMPGFISIKTFTAEDGERVSIIEFESEKTMLAWRNQPDHTKAQELGRKSFYSEYHIQVCQPIRDYSFPKNAD
ncbi:MAG TPA: antibiotic biosynthesis monooxygenase [Verrucomicrobiae bacterium]|nr:antibiotic biosynthesis monooxygenase [Verrucomicrobiae bacterium]